MGVLNKKLKSISSCKRNPVFKFFYNLLGFLPLGSKYGQRDILRSIFCHDSRDIKKFLGCLKDKSPTLELDPNNPKECAWKIINSITTNDSRERFLSEVLNPCGKWIPLYTHQRYSNFILFL